MDVLSSVLLPTMALLAVQPPAAGSAATYQDGSGRVWHASVNTHGAVLRNGRSVIYLGRGCDVRSPQFGSGNWGSANGGVLITFRRSRIGFARQDSPLPDAHCPL